MRWFFLTSLNPEKTPFFKKIEFYYYFATILNFFENFPPTTPRKKIKNKNTKNIQNSQLKPKKIY